MQNTVSQLIYEIGAKLDGSFNTNIRSANTQIDTISTSANKADTSLEKLKMQQQDLSKQFMQGKITLSDYNAGLDSIAGQQKALKTFSSLSSEQKKLTENLQKGKISIEEYQDSMDKASKKQSIFQKFSVAINLALYDLAQKAGRAVLEFFKSSVQASSDLNESMSKTAVIFGDAAKEIFKFADGAYAIGLSKRAALDGASSFALFAKSAGLSADEVANFSVKQVQLASDLASFFNTKPEDALNALRSGYAGQSEPLRAYNIMINETKLKQELLNMGIKVGSNVLTDNQRLLATQALITKQVTDATGDFDRTSKGLANTQRILQARFENLQANIGGTLTQSVRLIQGEFGRLLGQFAGSPETFNKTSEAIYKVTASVVSFIKIGLFIVRLSKNIGESLLNLLATAVSPLVDGFLTVTKSVKLFGSGMSDIIHGRFKEGFKDLAKSIDTFTHPDFAYTKSTAEYTGERFKKMGQGISTASSSILESIDAVNGVGFEPVSDDQFNKISKTSKAVSDLGNNIASTGGQTDEAKKKFEGLAGKLLDVQQQAQKATTEIGKNLTDALQKFSETVVSTTAETNQKLAQTVVDAQSKIDEINKKTDRTAEDTKQLAEYQKIVDARVGYEKRSQETIDAIKKKFADAGIDPATLGLDKQLATQKTFEQQLAETKRIASLDEFTRIEEEGKAKLLKLTEQTLQEVLIIKTKYDKQKEYEADMTAFLQDQSKIQQATVDAFANNAIAKYGEMANSLRNLISLQSQLGSVSAGAKKPQFHDGGFVGSQGGDVHSGEYVLNASMVRNMPSLVSQLEGIRSGRVQNNNINISANGGSSTDYDEVAQRLAYRLDTI